jgi:hypothetical protein
MEKLNRKGFFSTLFGGIAGVVAGTSVKASEPIVPPPVVETVVYCDKLVFTHSSGASCVMSFVDSDNFAIRVNNSENIDINIHSPLKKEVSYHKIESTESVSINSVYTYMTIDSRGNLGLGTCNPTARLDIRG